MSDDLFFRASQVPRDRTIAPRRVIRRASSKILPAKTRSTSVGHHRRILSNNFSEQSSNWVPYVEGQWHAREPHTYSQQLQSLLVNSHVEMAATLISVLAFVYPSYISFAVAALSQILLVGVPLQMLPEQLQRLKAYEVVSLGMFILSLTLLSYNLVKDNDFIFEASAALVFSLVFLTNRQIKYEVETSYSMKVGTDTYLGNRHFSTKFQIFKYMFMVLTIIEVLLQVDLLAIPVLYALLLMAILNIISVTQTRNRESIVTADFIRVNETITEWLLNQERIFTVVLTYQKVIMLVQLFETLLWKVLPFHTSNLRWLDMILQSLKKVGHSELDTTMISITVASIITGQLCQKALNQHFLLEAQDEQNGQNSTSNLSKQTHKKLIKNAVKVLDATLKVYKLITFDKRQQTTTEFRKSFYGFLPVHLTWLVRIAVTVFAYMYNSYIGWLHLAWVMASFILPLKWFYHLSVMICFPLVCLEFTLVYVSNMAYYSDAQIWQNPYLQLFNFHPKYPFFELLLLYTIVVLVGLMIPARLRYISYASSHGGSDMTKDMLVKNIKDAKSSVVWKILFILAVRLHTPVLFLMLFMGNQNFNLFQLGFMSFFIVYGASHSIFVKTSILLPMFVGYFIMAQYWWSLAYETMPTYNKITDFFYLVDGWQPPSNFNDFYWARLPNLTLWGLFLLMHLLHTICAQFPDKDQNLKYLAECETHIFDRIPTIAKYVKLVWDTLFILVIIGVVFWVATDLIRFKSNLINLVYLILFVITFGKMCSTSLDGSSHKMCIFYADLIKRYSAVVLVILVTYHMLRFELFDWNDKFEEMKTQKSFIILYLQLIGFSEDESQTKSSVQFYTAYLIIGQILEYYFDVGRQKHEARDLYDWNEAFQTFKGTQRAHRFFKFDVAYIVYRCFALWRYLDMTATYFHLLTNGVIVYFSVKVSVSLFFAIHMTIIVGFYCYTASKIQAHQHIIEGPITMQHATDSCRHYKKVSSDLFLRARQSLWMTQYVITLTFMFAGYFDDFVVQLREWSDPNGTLINQFDRIQFYLYWTGCYFPEQSFSVIEGVQPVHFVFLILLCERQAQNWLFSRWGLNETMISKFAKLEYLMQLDQKGKEWLPQDSQHLSHLHNCHEVMKGDFAVTVDVKLPKSGQASWMMEEFNSALICVWQRIKLRTLVIKAIQNGIKRTFTKGFKRHQESDILASLRADDDIDTMSQYELGSLERELCKIFNQNIDLRSKFSKYKVRINGRDCVLYARIKDAILEQLYWHKKINQSVIPFLPYSLVKTLRIEIQQKMDQLFFNACQAHFKNTSQEDISERVIQEMKNTRLFQLRRDLQKVVSRRYSYEIWGDLKLLFKSVSLLLLTVNIIIKSNIASLIYLVLATAFLLRKSKQQVMRKMVYIVGFMCFLQYWVYLLNLTSESSPTPFPKMPYPNLEEPYGKYLIPIMYKFEFGRNMKHAYWYSFGVEIFTVEALWIDFLIFAFVSIYLQYYSNPVLAQKSQDFKWYSDEQSDEAHQASLLPENQGKPLEFCLKLTEYHQLMNERYPAESEFGNTVKRRLREVKDACPVYVFVRNSRLLTYTTMHIFTMILVLLMALCRRSFVSLVYVIALAPCLRSSENVLYQHDWFCAQNEEIQQCLANPEFQKLSTKQKNKIIHQIQSRYQWNFINLICVYLSIYSYMDFLSQVAYQIPYVPDLPILQHFGLHKIYPPSRDTFDYNVYISGNYQPPLLNVPNLIMQVLNCVILVTISTQAELFRSQGYIQFCQKKDRGLDLLMNLAKLKKYTITYAFNNAKMMKILAIQKTEQQIFGTAERIKINIDMYRKSQQRTMLEEYCRTYGGMYVPPDLQPELHDSQRSNSLFGSEGLKPMKKMGQALLAERQRREKLVAEQTNLVVRSVIPLRARLYLFMMRFSQSYIFIQSKREMQKISSDMEKGHHNTGIDLNRLIRSDLLALLRKIEAEKGEVITEWPLMKLSDLRQTKLFCKWSHVMSRQVASIVKAVISNTATIAYCCMLLSMYTNAGMIAIIYPIMVFGYALLEETRPGKRFWRFMLVYTLFILLAKYIVNINIVNEWLDQATTLPLIDSFVKFGLHHFEQTADLVWHMLPEMMIVTAILCHEIVEQSTGLFEEAETEVETVPQAIDRIFKKNQHDDSFESDSYQSQDFYTFQNDESQSDLSQHQMLPLVSEPEIEEKESIWTSSYMQSIFPSVQQQKPGSDYYGYLTFVKCTLAIYLLTNFNQFSATGPFQETNIFQTEMVVVLFFQAFMLVMERYIARTENREQILRIKRTNDHVKPTIDPAQLFLPVKHDDLAVKLVIQNLKFQDLADKKHIASLQKLRQEQGNDIELTDSLVTNQQKCKFILHWLNLILVHAYIFWYLPIHTNITLYGTPNCGDQYGCKDFRQNESLQMFYLLYLFYFYLSARQISVGLPSFRRGSSTMLFEGSDTFEEEEDIGNALHQIFVNIPFLVEIRCVLDFALTRTALDVWQTCQLFQYNSDFFVAKTANRWYNRKVLGEEPPLFSKICCGYFCCTLMLSFILVPFLMFSNINGMTQYNPVIDNNIQFWVQVNLTSNGEEDHQFLTDDQQVLPFKLYENEAPQIYDFDQSMYDKRHFGEWPETKFFSPDQVQMIVASGYSDTTWIASETTRTSLQKYACIAHMQFSNDTQPGCNQFTNVSNIHNVSIGFQLKTLFRRDGPSGAKDASGMQQRNLEPLTHSQDQELLKKFIEISTGNCDQHTRFTMNITDFYQPKILLGESTKVNPIYFTTRETESEALQNLLLTYKCKDQWAISTDHTQLELTVFNQRIMIGLLQGYDIMTFYTGIVLMMGMYLRPVFIWTANRAFIYEITHPDPMLRLCESIHLSRARGDLKMEEENFRLLQDILRSPEVLHLLTGSSMKGGVAPSDDEQKAHLIPKAFN